MDRSPDAPAAKRPDSDAADPTAAETPRANVLLGEEAQQMRQKAAERDEFLDLLQRVRADYANYQKRVQKEMDSQRRFAAQPLILDLLPAMDNLERALQAAESSANSAGLLDGIRMVHQQLLGALA